MNDLISVTVSDGKYTIQQTAPGKWEALRYGEAWPAFAASGPDNLHVALAYEIDSLRRQMAFYAKPEGTFQWALHHMLWEQKEVFRESMPGEKFEFDGAEGGAFWSYTDETDELELHAFSVGEILASDWRIKV